MTARPLILLTLRSRVYETVERPSVCLSLSGRGGGFYCPDSASSLYYKGSARLNGTIKLSVCVRKDHNSQLIKSNSVNVESLQTYTTNKCHGENNDIRFSSIYKQTNGHA